MSEQNTAVVYDFITFKKSRIPKEAQGFCTGLTLLQAIMKLTSRISDQYDNSIAVDCEIDEDEAELTEHIIGVLRDTYNISTEEINNHLQATFNLRENIQLDTNVQTQAK